MKIKATSMKTFDYGGYFYLIPWFIYPENTNTIDWDKQADELLDKSDIEKNDSNDTDSDKWQFWYTG
jgi:hypothetical protein